MKFLCQKKRKNERRKTFKHLKYFHNKGGFYLVYKNTLKYHESMQKFFMMIEILQKNNNKKFKKMKFPCIQLPESSTTQVL